MKTERIFAIFVIVALGLIAIAGWMRPSGNGTEPVVFGDGVGPIAPETFLVAPCKGIQDNVACVILAAGGKRILIGAPAGIGDGMIAGDKTPPDAVLLPSLHAHFLEGLDELRNNAWQSGRRRAIPVSGTLGIEGIVEAINRAYTIPDALAYLEGVRQGGFEATAITANVIQSGSLAFDTGDLRITALKAGPERLAFWIDYYGQTALVADCEATDEAVLQWPEADTYIGCTHELYQRPSNRVWPLQQVITLEISP